MRTLRRAMKAMREHKAGPWRTCIDKCKVDQFRPPTKPRMKKHFS
jgi:hypothetical protein